LKWEFHMILLLEKWKKEYENANLPLLPTETTQTIYVDTQFHYGIGKEVLANISYTPRKWYDRVVLTVLQHQKVF
jgi:hypothetical protein